MRNLARKALAILTVLSMLASLSVVALADKPDTSADAAMTHGDYSYNQNGATKTDTGYLLKATDSDIDARIWVNNCPVGNAVKDGGVTIGFKAVMPESNEGRIYYSYSGAQDVVEQNCFVGLKPVTGGYKLLKNISHDDATDEFYTDTVYTGTIAFMLYIESNHFDVYANGDWVGEGETTVDLATRWYYSFISYWAGGKDVKAEIKDMVYLKGAAITGGDSGADPDAYYEDGSATQAPGSSTPQPTNAATTADPSGSNKIRDIKFDTTPYSNGGDGSMEAVDGILHLIKDKTGSNFSQMLWTNDAEKASTGTTSFVFDAKVAGGVGHSWDGYAFALRYGEPSYADREVLRLVPTATGVNIAVGAGNETLAVIDGTGYHAYSVVYSRDDKTFSVYVDGELVVDGRSTSVPSDGSPFQAYMIKSGNNDATNVEMWLGGVETWTGSHVRTAATTSGGGSGSAATAQPTTAPTTADPSGANKIRDIKFDTTPYSNGGDGSMEAVDGILHLIKDKTGSNFSQMLWTNDAEKASSGTTSFVFDAKVAGGAGHSWDGYAFALRYGEPSYADHEVLRLVPTATGVNIAVGAGSETLAVIDGTGYHAYSIVYSRDDKTFSVYVDGALVLDGMSTSVPSDGSPFQAYMIKSGNNDATNVEMWLGAVETWTGSHVRTAATTSGGGSGSAATAQPTTAPTTADPSGADKIRDIKFDTTPYSNGGDGSMEAVDGILHLIKDKTGSNFSQMMWSNSRENASTGTTSFVFDAKVAGGVGHSWDGYAFALRYGDPSYADHEVLRLVPTATGVEITVGAGSETMALIDGAGYHAYSIVYSRDDKTFSVYVDGELTLDGMSMSVPSDGSPFQAYMIKSGNNGATNVEMWLGGVETWTGSHVRTAPITGGGSATAEPTETPTDAPPAYKPGDMDDNDVLNAKDITLLRRYIANQGSLADKPAADFDGDGFMNAKDVTKLRRAIANQSA